MIYNGIYYLLEDKSLAIILDNLGSLISDIEEKNISMNVHVFQIVPSSLCQEMHAKIEEYNGQLLKWGEANGINIICCFIIQTWHW